MTVVVPTHLHAAVIGVAVLCTFSPLSAQTIRGRLIDDATDRPIVGATLRLLTLEGEEFDQALSNDQGVFVLDADLGGFHLEAERIGYRTTRSLEFQMERLDTLAVEFRIDAQAVLMAPILVVADDAPGEDLFAERAALGEGFFYTAGLIDSIRPEIHVAEIFREADPRTWVKWRYGRREDNTVGPIPDVISRLGRGCVDFVVDRIPVAKPFFETRPGGPAGSPWGVPPLSELTPENLVAVEVYRAPHELPAGFVSELRPRNLQERETVNRINDLYCGVVVFWTDRGW